MDDGVKGVELELGVERGHRSQLLAPRYQRCKRSHFKLLRGMAGRSQGPPEEAPTHQRKFRGPTFELDSELHSAPGANP